MTTPASPTRPPGSGPNRPSGRSNQRLVIVGAVVAVVVALVVAVLVAGGDDDTSTSDTTGSATETSVTTDSGDETGTTESAGPVPVVVDGTALDPFTSPDDDPAVGATFPTMTGTDFAGEPVVIEPDGRPKMILFLAHWCPHCQDEVPVVQEWVDGGGLPEGVDLMSVSTAADDRRPNYPPAEWLESEGWTAPVLDDVDNSAAVAAGLTAFPYFVFVDGDGTVVGRTTGELPTAQLDDHAATLAATAS